MCVGVCVCENKKGKLPDLAPKQGNVYREKDSSLVDRMGIPHCQTKPVSEVHQQICGFNNPKKYICRICLWPDLVHPKKLYKTLRSIDPRQLVIRPSKKKHYIQQKTMGVLFDVVSGISELLQVLDPSKPRRYGDGIAGWSMVSNYPIPYHIPKISPWNFHQLHLPRNRLEVVQVALLVTRGQLAKQGASGSAEPSLPSGKRLAECTSITLIS